MDDWPPQPDGSEDDERTPTDDQPEPSQDPFSMAVGDAWEWGRRGTIIDEML